MKNHRRPKAHQKEKKNGKKWEACSSSSFFSTRIILILFLLGFFLRIIYERAVVADEQNKRQQQEEENNIQHSFCPGGPTSPSFFFPMQYIMYLLLFRDPSVSSFIFLFFPPLFQYNLISFYRSRVLTLIFFMRNCETSDAQDVLMQVVCSSLTISKLIFNLGSNEKRTKKINK